MLQNRKGVWLLSNAHRVEFGGRQTVKDHVVVCYELSGKPLVCLLVEPVVRPRRDEAADDGEKSI